MRGRVICGARGSQMMQMKRMMTGIKIEIPSPMRRARSAQGESGKGMGVNRPVRQNCGTKKILDLENTEIGGRCISTGPSPLDLGIGAMA